MKISVLAAGWLVFLGAQPALGAADDVSMHRALWRERGPAAYSYAYQKFCDCNREAPPQTVVTVQSGRIVRVYHKHADSPREVPAREGSLDLYWTIEGLFDLIEAAEAANATVRVSYDEARGYPQSIYIDYDAGFVGDEVDLRSIRLDASD